MLVIFFVLWCDVGTIGCSDVGTQRYSRAIISCGFFPNVHTSGNALGARLSQTATFGSQEWSSSGFDSWWQALSENVQTQRLS